MSADDRSYRLAIRKAKKLCKQYMRKSRLKHLRTYGRTFVAARRSGFACSRWWSFIIVAENHECLRELVEEGRR